MKKPFFNYLVSILVLFNSSNVIFGMDDPKKKLDDLTKYTGLPANAEIFPIYAENNPTTQPIYNTVTTTITQPPVLTGATATAAEFDFEDQKFLAKIHAMNAKAELEKNADKKAYEDYLSQPWDGECTQLSNIGLKTYPEPTKTYTPEKNTNNQINQSTTSQNTISVQEKVTNQNTIENKEVSNNLVHKNQATTLPAIIKRPMIAKEIPTNFNTSRNTFKTAIINSLPSKQELQQDLFQLGVEAIGQIPQNIRYYNEGQRIKRDIKNATNAMTSFLDEPTIPEEYKSATKKIINRRMEEDKKLTLRDAIEKDLKSGQSSLQFFQRDYSRFQKEQVLPQLRLHENLNPEHLSLRRKLETEMIRPDQAKSINEVKQHIEDEYQKKIDQVGWGDSLWNWVFCESNKDVLLREKNNAITHGENNELDNISNDHKKNYEYNIAKQNELIKQKNYLKMKARKERCLYTSEYSNPWNDFPRLTHADFPSEPYSQNDVNQNTEPDKALARMYLTPRLQQFLYQNEIDVIIPLKQFRMEFNSNETFQIVTNSIKNAPPFIYNKKNYSQSKISNNTTDTIQPSSQKNMDKGKEKVTDVPDDTGEEWGALPNDIIELEYQDFSLNEIDGFDLTLTPATKHFAQYLNVDPRDFHKHYDNHKQNILQKSLVRFVNYIDERLAPTEKSELETKIYNVGYDLLRVVHLCNKQNYTELGSATLTLCKDIFTFSVVPHKAIARRLITIAKNPKPFIKGHAQGFVETIKELHEFCNHLSLSMELNEFEQFAHFGSEQEAEKIAKLQHYSADVEQKINSLVNALATMSLKEREEFFAQNAINAGFDTLITKGIGKSLGYFKKGIQSRGGPIDVSYAQLPSRNTSLLVDLNRVQKTTKAATRVGAYAITLEEAEKIAETILRKDMIPSSAAAQQMHPVILLPDLQEIKKDLARKAHAEQVAKAERIKILLTEKSDYIDSEIVHFIEQNSGNTIKEFSSKVFKEREEHIFSKNHLENGIKDLGNDRTNILDIFVDLIIEADKQGLLQEVQLNQMETIINGQNTLIKFKIENGKMLGLDAYIIDKPIVRRYGNIFTFILDKYK